MASVWIDGVKDGLTAAGHRAKAESLAASDVRVAFFGDLFRPPGSMAAQDPPYTEQDLTLGVGRELLMALYDAAVIADPSIGPPSGAMGPGRMAAQAVVERLLRSRTFGSVAKRAFIGNLAQVAKFLTVPAVKDAVLERVVGDITAETKVLIGHSMGTIVAYEYLCRYAPSSITMLITLGCPLGIRNVVFDRLTPAPIEGHGSWPGSVSRWVNIADPNDVVAMRKQLSELFSAPAGMDGVDDRVVDNGDLPHAIDRYLNARETGSALGDVLG